MELPYEEAWLRNSAEKSLLTALALDALGSAYESFDAKRRTEWLFGGKANLPRGARRIGSYNTDMLMLILRVLYSAQPMSAADSPELKATLKLALATYTEVVSGARSTNPYYLATRHQYNTCVALPVGVAVGYYVALHAYSDDWHTLLNEIIAVVASVMPFNAPLLEELRFVAVLMIRLLHLGYFGHAQIDEMHKYNAVPNGLRTFFQDLYAHEYDAVWLNRAFVSVSLPHRTTYGQRVIAEATFYLARVATQYEQQVLASNPRQQLASIFTHAYTQLPDIAFMFGAMCTASEHGYALVPKPFRLAVEAKHSVRKMLSSM